MRVTGLDAPKAGHRFEGECDPFLVMCQIIVRRAGAASEDIVQM